jgi:hypothetical protein
MATMAYADAPDPGHSVDVDCEIPDIHNRLTTLFRIILAIPHWIVLSILNYAVRFTALAAWLITVILGRQPEMLWNFHRWYVQWSANVGAYLLLMRDEYPPFGREPYPVVFELEYPERQNRLTVFFRLLLVIPHAIVLAFVGIVALLLLIFTWFAILITGRFPNGCKNFILGTFRWGTRVNAYMLLLRDEYPPFGFSR